jgi:uncharacterized protein (TIGR02266 family)
MKSLLPFTHEPIDLAIELSADSESHFFVDLSGDLSRGGIFVATWRDIAVGSLVRIACRLLGEVFVLRGMVVWQRDAGEGASPGLGVLLARLAPAPRATVERFCRAREPLYYEVDALAA